MVPQDELKTKKHNFTTVRCFLTESLPGGWCGVCKINAKEVK